MRRRLPIVAIVRAARRGRALAVVLLKEGVDRTQRGTGQGTVKPEPGTRVVSVKRTSAKDFDPAGDDEEHHGEARAGRRQGSRHRLDDRGLQRARNLGKDGVGIYVDADPGVDARSIAIDTPEPGWKAEIRVRRRRAPAEGDRRGWKKVAGGTVDSASASASASTGDRHRYYLVWITGARAPGAERVEDLRDHAVRAAAQYLERVAAALGAEALERESRAGGRRARGNGTPVASHSFG